MSRESILKAVKANKPDALALPNIDLSVFDEDINLVDRFKENIEFVGGRLLELNGLDHLDTEIKRLYPEAQKIVSCTKQSGLGTVSVSKETDPHTLEDIDLAIIKGSIAVAENGAVWVSDEDMFVRALPFITNDLILVVPKNAVYLHMHEVFEVISKREKTFGTFISGPSKTADIEQCLVVGAHGAISLTVVLY
ncbi:LutC/YkgG family protein [Aestuariibaculum sediminum]|uniref:LUD domain-containing protein n=1 Tax=Aestuariibaculum sediminum TaxID=2770637 RepID=A0A8J6Q8T7_9FLAO|nr:LUD domain-containing protein [Aestuariibaculum sediminum]MBD0831867.1 LUD domain-containing protein [Aestuariibaculum sediminum]